MAEAERLERQGDAGPEADEPGRDARGDVGIGGDGGVEEACLVALDVPRCEGRDAPAEPGGEPEVDCLAEPSGFAQEKVLMPRHESHENASDYLRKYAGKI